MKRFWLAVAKEKEDAVIKLLTKEKIGYTNRNGMFIFDLISLIIGVVAGLAFGIILF